MNGVKKKSEEYLMTIWRLTNLINETKNKYFLLIEFSR
jgi:hypothetical protein